MSKKKWFWVIIIIVLVFFWKKIEPVFKKIADSVKKLTNGDSAATPPAA